MAIITQTDLFRLAVDALGARHHGVRVSCLIPDMRGMLSDLINVITREGGFFVSLVTLSTPDPTTEMVTFKIKDLTLRQVEDCLSDLSFEVLDIRVT